VPGSYLILAVVFGLVPWLLARVRARPLVAVLAVAVLLDVAGLIAGLRLYPWTDLLVAAIAAAGGVLVGRAVPARFRPMALLMLVLAVLDAVQVIVGSTSAGSAPSQRPAFQYYVMLVIATPLATSAIGIFDLLLVTAMAEHWRRRGAGVLLAISPGVLGLLLTYPAALVLPRNLPLIPFLFAGFLLTQAAVTLRARQR
jgi:hypothetical protein